MSGAGSTPEPRRVVLTRRAALATAAALALARSAPARADQKQERLAETLSAALTLELTAVESYGLLIASGVVRGRVRRALAACRVDDRRHAHVLRGALADVGATSPPPPLANEIGRAHV